MQFKDIFARPIDRHMDSVIKSDDERYLASELEEYVLTPDITRSLQRFCDEYNDPNSSGNGAWISGFYGSGKSHLLKMLSCMLENSEVSGKPALDYMKPKFGGNAMLESALIKACEQTPSESILFNVGGKSDSQRRDTGESLLNAFIKVLNEKCGYFNGEQAHVAMLERDLDRSGLLETFKDEVKVGTGREWDTVRKNPLLFAGKASAAYDRATGQPEGTTSNVFEYYSKSYHPTPEDFANWVWEYIQKREKEQPGFRLNFFADEMGQYIADSVPLLQMLQDIAENLNTKCRRRAWIVVVSQEEMGDMSSRLEAESAASQFSKIQARFKVLIKIPANDSNTVVRERLLEKNNVALPAIDKLYDEHSGEFDVKLNFPDGATKYKPYDGRDDFAATYPLVGYQFSLFHQALTGLSNHDAFTGQYVSTGARNMLGTTHRVLLARMEQGEVENGDLISFDAMFEGLRDELKSEVFSAIGLAEDHFGNPLGVRVLKALLLVKYVEGFRATPTNLAVLLYDGFACNQAALKDEIDGVCRELSAQTYIRRNGDAYEYLTSDEKDVEAEIKRESISPDDVSRQIGKLLSEIIGQTKVKYSNGGFSTTFAYDLMVDGVAAGSQRSELKVNFLTDLTDGADVNYKYAQPKQLLAALPRETMLTRDVMTWMRTNSYIGTHQHVEGRLATILGEKKVANESLRKEILDELKSEMNGCLWATGMNDVTDDVAGSGTDRLESAVLEMVKRSYPLLSMLREPFDNKGIYAASTGTKLLPGESMSEYCQETLAVINNILASSARCLVGGTVVNSLEQKLIGGDHGWPVEAVRQAVGVLALNNKIECLRNDEPLEGVELAAALSKADHLDGVEVKLALGASQEQVDALRTAYREVAGMEPPAAEAKELAADLAQRLRDVAEAARNEQAAARALPFASHYAERLAELDSLAGHKRDWYIQNAADQTEQMRACIKDLAAMRTFANGKPGEIYADAASFLAQQEANIAAVPQASLEVEKIRQLLADPECYETSTAPIVKSGVANVRAAIEDELTKARTKASNDFDAFTASFRLSGDYRAASEAGRHKAEEIIASCAGSIKAEGQIVTLRTLVATFKATKSTELYQAVAPAAPSGPADGEGRGGEPAPKVVTVSLADALPANFRDRPLSSESDVNAFVDALRDELARRVAAGEKVIL